MKTTTLIVRHAINVNHPLTWRCSCCNDATFPFIITPRHQSFLLVVIAAVKENKHIVFLDFCMFCLFCFCFSKLDPSC
jgi:hypothetical protein